MRTLLGVVAPFAGTGTVRDGGADGPWTARLRMVCAQEQDGEVTDEVLTLVSRGLPDEEATRIVAGLGGYDVVRCRVDGRVLLGRPERAEPTPELAAVLERLRRPVVVEHELGTVAWTLESEAFDGEVGAGLSVRLDTADAATARRLLDGLAAAFAGGLAPEGVTALAVAELLDLANEEWLDEPISAGDFRRRVRFTEWVLYEDGGFEAYADDDGIFAGHAVLVSGSLADGATGATIAG